MKNYVIGVFICYLLVSVPITLASPILKNGKNLNTSTIDDTYDLAIISSSYYLSIIEELKNHKNSIGISTIIIDVENIYDGTYFPVQGRDEPEQIKYFIKNMYDQWNISYILILGSVSMVPTRRVSVMPFQELPYDYTSELYYADIYDNNGNFSTWDSDNDSKFLEWYNSSQAEDIQQDLTPEVAIGRISFAYPDQVERIIARIITYETQTHGEPWFNNIVVAAGDTFKEFEGSEGELNTQKALDIMQGFTPEKLWASNGKLDRFGLSIYRAIRKGCGFLYLAGHGTVHTWGTYDSARNPLGFFSTLHALFLMNLNKLPVCILSGCHVNKIEKGMCLGLALIQPGLGGTIATIGPTHIGYLGFEYNGGGLDFMELQFFREYANGSRIIGDIWKACHTELLQTYPIQWNEPAGINSAVDAKMVSEWILLGDPSLHIGGI